MALPRPGSARALVGVAALPAAFALAAGLLLFAPPASAQITTLEEAPPVVDTEEPFPFAVLGLTGLGTFNTYSMSDVNKSIEQMNREITQPGVKFPRFTRGASMGGGIRAILDERLILEATWEQVNAGETIGGTAVNDLNASAHAYLFTAAWDMMKARRVAFGPALGMGYYDSIAEQTITETPVGEDPHDLGTIRFNGSALGAHGGVTFETSLTGHVWVNAFLG